MPFLRVSMHYFATTQLLFSASCLQSQNASTRPAYFLYNRYYTIDCCVMAPSYAGTDLSILLLLSLEYCTGILFLPLASELQYNLLNLAAEEGKFW